MGRLSFTCSKTNWIARDSSLVVINSAAKQVCWVIKRNWTLAMIYHDLSTRHADDNTAIVPSWPGQGAKIESPTICDTSCLLK